MIKTVNGEAPFQVLASNFSIGPTDNGYTLQISADGENYSDLFSVGAGVTRMVTGVANGSFYRLKNNTGDAKINWRTQCDDGGSGGGGSTYVLPPATDSTLGGIKVGDGLSIESDGTLSAEGGSSNGDVLKGIANFPQSAGAADVISKYNVEEEEQVGAVVDTDGFDGTGLNVYYFAVSDLNSIEFTYGQGRYSISFANDELGVTLVSGTDTLEAEGYYVYWKGESGGIANSNDYGVLNITDGSKSFTVYKESVFDATDFVIPSTAHIDELNYSTVIEKRNPDTLYKFVEGAGKVAEWLKPINEMGDTEGTGLVFSSIPDGTVLFEFKYSFGGEWRKVVYLNNTLYCFEADGETLVDYIPGVGYELYARAHQYGNIYYVRCKYIDGHRIGIWRSKYLQFQNVWDGSVQTDHWELVDKYNYPYTPDNGTIIPMVNDKGQVVGKAYDVTQKQVVYNNTGYSNNAYFAMVGGNFPQRMWFPTQGGNSGQVLVSTGGNEPVWQSMIKAIQITSDAYEALTTKDPNTLYLIVDE